MPAPSPWRGTCSAGQPVPVRLRWFLAISSVLLAVVGTTVVVYDTLDGITGASDQVISVPSDDGSAEPGRVPDDDDDGDEEGGFVEVAGRIDLLRLEGAVPDPPLVPTPLRIESDRGFGNGGEITGVTVGDTASAIVWDGGRPFVLSAGPGLLLDEVVVVLDDGDVLCTLGRGAHRLPRGDYQLDTPVAVGGSGIAAPRDRVAFTAGADGRFDAHGDAALRLPPETSYAFAGRGQVSLVGDLVVTTDQGGQAASSLDLRDGAYQLTLSPTEGGGWTVSGRVQSRVVGDLALGTR